MYNELVYHLDLCILAYQLYGQTLAWPMDPYYEQQRRKLTSRRDNFMERIHKNDKLFPVKHETKFDPVLFNYEQLYPWVPCFVKPETKWDVFSTPKEITDRIGHLSMHRLGGEPSIDIANLTPVGDNPRNSQLLCFEGKTGNILADHNASGTKSFMGFIQVRQRSAKPEDYDVHIVFRGSRSGSGERAMMQGKFREKGSADWVTDMDFGKMVSNPVVSKQGKQCRGFNNSIMSMLGNIVECMSKIQEDRKHPPRKIYLAGHSLGGALATHCASILSQGDPTETKVLKDWPFNDMKLFTYGAPVTGDKAFCDYLALNVQIIRAYINGDKIPQQKLNLQGRPTTPQTHAGTVLSIPPIEAGGAMWLNHHEPSNTRRALVSWLKGKGVDVSNVPASEGTAASKINEPWYMCTSILDVLAHPSFNGTNAANIQKQLRFFITDKKYLDAYVGIMSETLGKYTSYKQLKKFESTMKAKVKAVQGVMDEEAIDLKLIQRRFVERKNDIGDEYTYYVLMLCAVLRRIIQVPGDAQKLLNDPAYEELRTALRNI
jgi:hypothetical protein